jgi:hypothetical protein
MIAEPDLFSLPELPYAGSSGWSGSSTSKTRADDADRSGETRDRQAYVLRLLARKRDLGATWKDIAEETGWHHGNASGALSVLHKTAKIARLTEKRNRCKVYVLPEYVYGRDTERHGGRLRGTAGNAPEVVRMMTERQADVLIAAQPALINQVARTIEGVTQDDAHRMAEKVIGTVADWLSNFRPAEFGDDYCTPLDLTAFILRGGQLSE